MSLAYLLSVKNVFGLLSSTKKKEKLDFILEPLQAMVQLSLLSYCPVGSKLTIQDNLLQIQLPGVSQGLLRFMNDDTKDDLYYLFNVFRRFLNYYKDLEEEYKVLYENLINMSINGIDKLIQTYTDSGRISILHTLQMYKMILIKKDFFENPCENEIENEEGNHSQKNSSLFNNFLFSSTDLPSSQDINKTMKADSNIDVIFINITKLYGQDELDLLDTSLKLVSQNSNLIKNYIEGINLFCYPINMKIKKWINDNIAL